MVKKSVVINGKSLPLFRINTLVIGSGASSLNAAVHLYRAGITDMLIVTKKLGSGTSANAGSDKQTYYKLSLADVEKDSPRDMAETYFNGGAMHGDLALIESALSVREFFHLVELGVEFPFNEYGEYVGYKTDNDPKGRGTSAGPWTSQQMVAKLLEEVNRFDIRVLDDMEIISLLTSEESRGKRVIGAIGINRNSEVEDNLGFTVFECENIIFGVGGPGGVYEDSVYPEGHVGSIGLALEHGAIATNLTEGQFGIASIDFRWNLSGSYQQVIPRYYSLNENGERIDFLNRVFPTTQQLSEAIFLKGYQWPFDYNRVDDYGSSLIDLLVYRETKIKDREVFLDFRNNISSSHGLERFDIDKLSGKPRRYLKKSSALLDTPIERLERLNPQAVELYLQHGIDLHKEPLRVSVCAQHSNGGLGANIWWESNISHLFSIGEVNGSHGVSRPGGSALNAGQVGGLRASQYIANKYFNNRSDENVFKKEAQKQIIDKFKMSLKILEKDNSFSKNPNSLTPVQAKLEIQKRMSQHGALVRTAHKITKGVKQSVNFHKTLPDRLWVNSPSELTEAFEAIRLSLTSRLYLKAIEWYINHKGGSRGSYLIRDQHGGKQIDSVEGNWCYREENESLREKVQETYIDESGIVHNRWVRRRSIPNSDRWFENIWQKYLTGSIFE